MKNESFDNSLSASKKLNYLYKINPMYCTDMVLPPTVIYTNGENPKIPYLLSIIKKQLFIVKY